jgi:predicted DNA-binding protein
MKILRSIYIDIEQLEKLDSLSKQTRVPKATYIREALELVLEKYERQIKFTQKRKEEF